jgi:hypothetical protein
LNKSRGEEKFHHATLGFSSARVGTKQQSNSHNEFDYYTSLIPKGGFSTLNQADFGSLAAPNSTIGGTSAQPKRPATPSSKNSEVFAESKSDFTQLKSKLKEIKSKMFN